MLNESIVDGAVLNTWIDLSGNDNHATQYSDSNSILPTYDSDGINGYSSIVFDGIDDYMTVVEDMDNDSDSFSLFMVMKINPDSIEDGLLGKVNGDDDFHSISFNDSNQIEFRYGDVVVSSTETFSDEDVIILAYRVDAGTLSININGEQLTMSATSFSNSMGSGNSNWLLGAGYDSSSITDYFQGSMGEILYFSDSLSTMEFSLIQYYLSQKWDLGASVDSDGDSVFDDSDAFPLDVQLSIVPTADSSIDSPPFSDSFRYGLMHCSHMARNHFQGLASIRVDFLGSGHHAFQFEDSIPELIDNQVVFTDDYLDIYSIILGSDLARTIVVVTTPYSNNSNDGALFSFNPNSNILTEGNYFTLNSQLFVDIMEVIFLIKQSLGSSDKNTLLLSLINLKILI